MGNQHLSLSLFLIKYGPIKWPDWLLLLWLLLLLFSPLPKLNTYIHTYIHTTHIYNSYIQLIHTTDSPTIEKKKTIHASNLSYLATYASSSFGKIKKKSQEAYLPASIQAGHGKKYHALTSLFLIKIFIIQDPSHVIT